MQPECKWGTACNHSTAPSAIHYDNQARWTAEMVELLKTEPESWAGFSFVPKIDAVQRHLPPGRSFGLSCKSLICLGNTGANQSVYK
jgi:hypothetical protein